jgi:hypothetical protein
VIKSEAEVSDMEVTIKLPEKVFANLANEADRSHRPIDELIAERIERDFAVDADELEKQISVCSDTEVREIAGLEMPLEQDERLSRLLDKQNKGNLSAVEQKELWRLMDLNRLTTLKKDFALRELSRRGLNGDD